MEPEEGARREVIQTVRHGIDSSRRNVEFISATARAWTARKPGRFVPAEMLRQWEETLREEAASYLLLADAIREEREER